MKKILAMTALALAAGTTGTVATAAVVCEACEYLGNPGTYIGLHSPITQDNSTVSNATTGQNGTFNNTWVWDLNPAGAVSVNAIFLPTANISNFDVSMYEVDSSTCAPNTATDGGACSAVDLGALLIDGATPIAWASGFDFTSLDAGQYAFVVSGDISGIGATQPTSYVGQIQVQSVPEPTSLLLAGLGLLGLGFLRKKA